MGYAGMTAGPPLIGFIAGQTGLRLALGIPALLALGITIGARALGPHSPPWPDISGKIGV
jgi:hypothetical protein